jgi:hypothetical protein
MAVSDALKHAGMGGGQNNRIHPFKVGLTELTFKLSFRPHVSEGEIFISVFYKANVGRFLVKQPLRVPSVEMTAPDFVSSIRNRL